MCYHVSINRKLRDIELRTGRPMNPEDVPGYSEYYHVSGFSKPHLPVLSNDDPDFVRMYRWGLIPFWVKDEASFRANTLNAKSETIFESASYKNNWKNRCVVLVDAFFEPHSNSGRKESWAVKRKDGGLISLGAIWSNWKGLNTFSIVTTPASPLMAEVHNEKLRMPLILDRDKADAWILPDLSKEEMSGLMGTPEVDCDLDAYRVIDGVTNSRIDTNVPQVLDRYL